ncbi:hypothetical protein PC129_g15234 [Phytophthora cactorum]|uniref:Uncharacterized protein n=3 Tax=Phytophthora cactorum TaxID=29920 RepID=A0A329S906_9STRA|nr:hypothetical protein PC113_g13573 [Phytophthora cactorum]KAG2890421.1 hypothetical protein PC114_g17467 [Phytophthora cactorum]KAG2903175.1 hypothetical protein PC115_g15408 [Phytophthora cactorum]KAG2929192.1 hypothetical protein PC117_g14056 [Phytophthora cactorum]KAG3154914.1 hypothetical protein C6341_g15555 [Phytophthora cactorum]
MGEITESKAWHDNAAIKGSTVLKIAQREGVELPSGTILSRGKIFKWSLGRTRRLSSQPLRDTHERTLQLLLMLFYCELSTWLSTGRRLKALMKSFDKVANICEEVEGFVRDKHGPALRTHFDKIVRQHRDAEVVSRRASGTVEEYDERDMLLQDITTRMDDFQQLQAAEKNLRRAKVDGIEASGALMRRLNGNGRATKVTKLERVSAVTDAIALAITEMNKGDPQKYAFLNSRLQFEKEEAEKAREHAIKMELHRQEAQRARDERLLAAERERENFMMS